MKETLTKKLDVPFTQIANVVLNDPKISWKAKGIFGYITSKPLGWDFSGDRITKDATDGRDSTYAGVKELEAAGYLFRVRKPDGRVEYGCTWKKGCNPFEENPQKPLAENPQWGKSPMRKIRSISNKDSASNKEEESNKEDAANAAPLRVDSFFNALKRKERLDDGVPMNLKEFVLMCRGSQYRHIRLIGEYADERETQFITRGQWREFGRRNLRAARRLVPYTDRQIEDAMVRMKADFKGEGGFLTKWTFETLEKYLD